MDDTARPSSLINEHACGVDDAPYLFPQSCSLPGSLQPSPTGSLLPSTEDGQVHECIQYYHRIVAVVVVSGEVPVPLGLRFQQPGECEVACARLLLQGLVQSLGKRYFDILVADAIYLQKPFIEHIEQLGLRWLINL